MCPMMISSIMIQKTSIAYSLLSEIEEEIHLIEDMNERILECEKKIDDYTMVYALDGLDCQQIYKDVEIVPATKMIESLGPANTVQNSSSIEAQSKPATDSNPTPSEGEEKQSIVIPRDYNTISVCVLLMFFSVSRMMKSRDYTLLFLKKSFNCKWTSNISKIEILPSLHNRFEKYFFDSFLNSRS